MKNLSYPTRSEIKDIYSLILQGIDGLLFDNEILRGKFPYELIKSINEICSLCEKRVDYGNLFIDILYKTKKPMFNYEATASSTVKTSFNVQAKAIICVSDLGVITSLIAKYK